MLHFGEDILKVTTGLSHPESALAVADFNKDGIPDVVVSNQAAGTVSVLLGDGTGTFSIASGSPISIGGTVNGLVAGDFNGDGNPDFAVVDSASNSVQVFLGHGDGTFAAEVGSPYGVGTNPYWLAAGNFSGQGKLDLVVTNQNDNTIQFLFKTGNNRQTLTTLTSSLNPATFGTPVTLTATVTGYGGTPTGTVAFYDGTTSLGTGTLNGSGVATLTTATLIIGDHQISAVYGGDTNFAGSSSAPATLQTGLNPNFVATADFNGDGLPDLAVVSFNTSTVSTFLNSVKGFPSTPTSTLTLTSGAAPISAAVGDFNGDGKPDLALVMYGKDQVVVALGKGDGTFTLSTPANVGSYPNGVVAGDFNRDGHPDVAVANSNNNTVSVLFGDGTGNFPSGNTVSGGGMFGPESLATADFNHDGNLDLAVGNANSTVSIFLGDGTGGFTAASGSPVAGGRGPLVTADFNEDGNPDIAVATTAGQVIVLLGNGTGGFSTAPGSPITVGGFFSALGVGDFNVDGKLDLAATDQAGSVFQILLGDGTGGFTPESSTPPTGSAPVSVAVADFNGDGKLDLATANFGDSTATVLLGYGNGQFQQLLVQTILGVPGADLAPPSPFGDQAVGTTSAVQLVTLTNNGTAVLAITSITVSGPFVNVTSLTTCGSTLAVGASCQIAVEFAPAVLGAASGTLSVADSAPSSPQSALLTGTGVAAAPALTLIGPLVNNTLAFGSQVVGTASPAPQTLFVSNSGSADLTVSAVATTGDFSIIAGGSCPAAPFTLSQGGICGLALNFTPSATGTRTGTLTITHNAAGSPTIVMLTGTGTSSGAVLAPSTLIFGAQVVGTTSGPQSFTLTNTGSASISVTSFAASGDFALSSADCATLPATVAPGGVCTFVVTFTPTATGNQTGTATITDSLGQQFADLTGEGAAPGVQLSPANLDFGSQTVGTTSAEQTATLTNVGTAPLEVTGFSVAGDFAMTSPDCGTAATAAPVVLAPGGVCTLEVTFTPVASGTRAGIVVVTTSASSGGQFVVMEGNGNAPGLTLSPPNLTFGSQLVSTTSPSEIITLTNSGTSSLTVNTIAASGDFAVTSPDCTTLPATLAPTTGLCTLVVTFTPAAAGTRTGTLTVTSSASGGQAFADLEGFGEAPGVANLVLGPANLFFGSQAVSTTSVPQVVVLTSNGTSAATVASFAASGDFAVSSADCPTTPVTIEPGSICTLSVTFTPTGTGNRTGTLTISSTSGNGQEFVPLAGSGIGPTAVVTPPSLTFGTQVIGSASPAQTVALQNLGTAALTVNSFTVSGAFAVSSPDCPTLPATLPAATGLCTLEVTFNPTVVGPQYGTLLIADSSGQQIVTLTGFGGAPGTAVTPPNLTFGSQPVDTVSPAKTVTVTNTGNAAVGISSVTVTANFTQTNTCGTSLPAGKTCTISVASTPTKAAPTAGAVLVTNDNGRSVVSLQGAGAGPNLTVSPSNLTFASQNVGTASAPQTVTLANTGPAAVSVTAIIASADFAQTNDCGTSLAAGANCTISVTFSPTAASALNGSVLIQSSVGTQLVALTGTGSSTVPVVNLTPNPVKFAAAVVGTSAATQTVTVTNNSGTALQISSVTASSDFTQTNNCGKTVAPGAGCAITVGFTPSTSGARTGTLSVSDNAAGSPQSVSLTGTGQDFGLGPFNLTQTIQPGQTAPYALKLTPLGGFNQQVTLTCSGAPQNSTCTLDPSTSTLNGVNPATIMVRVATTSPSVSSSLRRWAPRLPPRSVALRWEWQALLALVLVLVLLSGTIRFAGGRVRLAVLSVVLALVLAWAACGGSSAPPATATGGTPDGSYTITVTATSGSLTHSLTVQLLVVR